MHLRTKEGSGYKPLVDTTEGIQQSIQWVLQTLAHQDVKSAGKE